MYDYQKHDNPDKELMNFFPKMLFITSFIMLVPIFSMIFAAIMVFLISMAVITVPIGVRFIDDTYRKVCQGSFAFSTKGLQAGHGG